LLEVGDADCNGSITSRDSQAIQRFVLGQTPLSQTEPCPEVGESVDYYFVCNTPPHEPECGHGFSGSDPVYGDNSCNQEVDVADSQRILAYVLGEPATQCTDNVAFTTYRVGENRYPVANLGHNLYTAW
jgi:hypothetical protein